MNLTVSATKTRGGWRGVALHRGAVIIRTPRSYAQKADAEAAMRYKVEAMSRGVYASRQRRARRPYVSQQQYLARIDWNINDAIEALHNAVSMRDWRGVEKYTAQIKKLEALRWKAENVGPKRQRRHPWWHPKSGSTAGAIYGRGRLP